MRPRLRRCAVTVLGLALGLLAFPVAASAHASFSESEPATQARLERPPQEVRIRFDQSVTIGAKPIRVLAEDGSELQGPARRLDGDRVVVVPVSGLEQGKAYTVRWAATSSDGHTVSGVYTFGVGVNAPPPTEAVGASGLTWRDDVARWGLFAAVALLVGGLAFRLVVLPAEVPGAVERRTHALTTVAAFAAIDIGVVGLVLRSQNALQLPFGDLLYGDLGPFATQTRFGIAWMVTTLGFAVCAALLTLAWALDALRLRWPALALGLVLLTAFPLSGHQATEPNASFIGRLADWLHLAAAALWVGGLLMLAFVVWRSAPDLRRSAFLRFSRMATVLVAVLLVAGTVVAIERLPAVADLWETSYGRILLLKLAIVALALGWGAVHHMVVRPRLERGDAAGRGIGRSLMGESAAAMGVLLVAAVLVNGSPPPVETGVQAAGASAARP